MGARARAGKTPGSQYPVVLLVAGRIGGAGMLAEAGPPAPRPVGAGRAAITPGPEELGPRAADSMGRELLGAAGATDEFADRGVAGRLRLADVRVKVLETVERAQHDGLSLAIANALPSSQTNGRIVSLTRTELLEQRASTNMKIANIAFF